MKILHVITSLNRGGIEIWLMNMLKHMPRDKWQMDFCCKGKEIGEMAEEAMRLGAKIYHVPLRPSHIGFMVVFGRLLVDNGYDVVHNHLEAYSWIPVYLSRKRGIPVITSFHNTAFLPQTWTRLPVLRQARGIYSAFSVNYALRHSDIMTACSKAVAEAFDIFSRRGCKNTYVLYYGVDFASLPKTDDRKEIRKSIGLSGDDKLIVHVGRFQEQKNHYGLIDVFNIVHQNVEHSKLILVGDGPLRSDIENYVCRKGLESSVIFMGQRKDATRIMAACDLFLFPSLNEGLPVAAIEASAIGIPIVGSRIPGLTEVVKNNETGLLFEVNDVRGMAEAVIKILQEKGTAEAFGINAMKWARKNFSVEQSKEKLINIYRSCKRDN